MVTAFLTTGMIAIPLALSVLVRDGTPVSAGTLIGPTSHVWITGASNVRRFTCRAGKLTGALELRGTSTREPVLSGQNVASDPSISIAVRQLDCGISKMNRHLRETLHSAEHPLITFRLVAYDVDITKSTPVARIIGEATVAGVTQAAIATATITADSLGYPHVRGTHALRMTDFGLQPPRRFGGLLRVRDEIQVHFDVALTPADSTVDAAGRLLVVDGNPTPNPGAFHVVLH